MKPDLYLYNTETRTKQRLHKEGNQTVTMYTCGPTVYNFVHIGNLRTFVFEDVLRRTIKYFGMPLMHVMNLTDVDDKTIKGALENKISLQEYVAPYEKAFFEDLTTLHVERAEKYPKATDYVAQMITMIQTLLHKGYAYQGADGCVYFNIQKFPSYGRLSQISKQQLKPGASERIETDEYEKDHVADFVLWKSYDPERDGDVVWESPFGRGRPGWHIECSAMATALLGDTLDIHVGGIDNMFPHHDNEIAQSECCTGKTFAKHWMHSEHLLVDGKKMSKSLGNFYTLRDLLNMGYTGSEVRFLLLQSHYRMQLNFTLEGLSAARHSLARLEDLMVRLSDLGQDTTKMQESHALSQLCKQAHNAFDASLADDLALSSALAVIFDLVREINALCDQQALGYKQALEVLALFREFDQVLGCIPFERSLGQIPHQVQEYLEKRELARLSKNWKEADKYRELIAESGFVIEDTKQGPKLKRLVKS